MDPSSLLQEGARELGIRIPDSVEQQFGIYLREIQRWNRTYNLTALRDPRSIVVKHFLDSFLFLAVFPEGTGLRLFDLGSGAGFPGLPLKLLRPDLICSLVEPSRKKSAFLRHVVRTLGLEGVDVRQERVENLVDLRQAQVVVSRALFRIAEVQALIGPLLSPGTAVVLSKGPAFEEEVREALFPVTVRPVRLPLDNVDRWLIIWIT